MESSFASITAKSFGSSLLGRLLGTSTRSSSKDSKAENDKLASAFKYRLGEEPTSPRPGSPGYQHGHWVIARPKLATPVIYQHGRSPANDRGSLGLGATRPASRESFRPSTRASTRPTTPWSEEEQHQLNDGDGDIHPWDDDQVNLGDTGEEELYEEQDEQVPYVDNPALDTVQPYFDDVYHATARPRHDGDAACLRRQRGTATAAAGALTNALAGKDRWTNQPPRPTAKVGDENDRAETLEHGARLLIRSLDEEFPASMRTRAAAALHKALTFQDVRSRVRDVGPLAVSSLVQLLRQQHDNAVEAKDPQGRQQRGHPHGKIKDLEIVASARKSNEKGWQQSNKAPLNAAACLRVLALSAGLPDLMASASAIPALVDGLAKGSDIMKSVCGGCLATLALADEEACCEIIDFGVMTPLLQLVRTRDLLREVTGWGALAALMRAPDAREAFVRAEGLDDLEDMLTRKRDKLDSNRFLLVCQDNAMQVLFRLCKEVDDNDGDSSDSESDSEDNDHESAITGASEGRNGSSSASIDNGNKRKHKKFVAGEFVAQEAVFRALLRHLRKGTDASMAAAAEVFKCTWEWCSRQQIDATILPVVEILSIDVWRLRSAAAQVIPHVYVQDERRLACAVSGGVEALIDMLRIKAQQMQGPTLAALLSLCEHPDVPALVAAAGGLPILAEYLTTARDVATRYVVLALMKVIAVCDKTSVVPFFPDMMVSEHVMGVSDDVDKFVEVFVEKRKASDYLQVDIENLRRFDLGDIASYKKRFQKLDRDASGSLDERELAQLLKELKVMVNMKDVRKFLVAVDKNKSGMIEFDEFLDIMWDMKHERGRGRGLLLRKAGVFLGDTFATAQAAIKRQAEKLSPMSRRSPTTTTSLHNGPDDGTPSTTTGSAGDSSISSLIESGISSTSGSIQELGTQSGLAHGGTHTISQSISVLAGTSELGNSENRGREKRTGSSGGRNKVRSIVPIRKGSAADRGNSDASSGELVPRKRSPANGKDNADSRHGSQRSVPSRRSDASQDTNNSRMSKGARNCSHAQTSTGRKRRNGSGSTDQNSTNYGAKIVPRGGTSKMVKAGGGDGHGVSPWHGVPNGQCGSVGAWATSLPKVLPVMGRKNK